MLKKSISILLSALLLFSIFATFAYAVEDECDCGMPPLVYVEGQTIIYNNPNDPNRYEIPRDPDMDSLVPLLKPCISSFAKAMVTDKWDDYCDDLVNAVTPFYADYGLTPQGTVVNETGPAFTWSPESVSSVHSNNNVFTYEYRYDQRLDPWDIADDLHNYIQVVKEKTNHSKVCLMSRCMGTAIAMAYLVKYGNENNFSDIYSYVYYNSTSYGYPLTNGLFSGDLELNTKGMARYAMEALDDSTLNEMLKATIDLMQKTYGLELPAAAITRIYDKVYENVLPRIIRMSYGATFGYWTMVSDEYYDQAKKLIFGGVESEWADFIAKIDNYHEKVQKQIPEMLLKLKATGMSVGIVCKYGFQMPPIVAGQDAQSDNLITVSSQSIGATEAKQGTVFSDKYLADAKTKGTDKYISPDRVIDASTGLLPENTWFVKDVWHQIMPVGIDPLLVTIARSPKEMTVWDNPEFPQYLLYSAESDSMSPLTKDNCNTEPPEHSLFQAVIRFFKSVYSLIKEKLTELINKEA